MSTFSELVDRIVAERQRPDLRIAAASYVNQVIRQVHSRPNTGSSIRFDANRLEHSFTLAGNPPYVWPIPFASRFQSIEAIYNRTVGVYHKERNPSVIHNTFSQPFHEYKWYRSGPTIIIVNALEGQIIDLSYHEYPRPLAYKAVDARVVTYDYDTDAYVLVAGGGEPTEEQLALETNWLLQRWTTLVEEGTRAALFRNTGDESRGRLSYSSFQEQRLQLIQNEPCTTEA